MKKIWKYVLLVIGVVVACFYIQVTTANHYYIDSIFGSLHDPTPLYAAELVAAFVGVVWFIIKDAKNKTGWEKDSLWVFFATYTLFATTGYSGVTIAVVYLALLVSFCVLHKKVIKYVLMVVVALLLMIGFWAINGGYGMFCIICLVLAFVLVFVIIKLFKKDKRATVLFENETEEMKEIRKMQGTVNDKIEELSGVSERIQSEIDKVRAIENQTIFELFGKLPKMKYDELYINYETIKEKYGSDIDSTPLMQCDRTISNAEKAVKDRWIQLNNNNMLIDKYKKMYADLDKQYAIQHQIEKQKVLSAKLNTEISDSEGNIAETIHGGNTLERLKEFEAEIKALRDAQIQLGIIDI